MNQQKPDQGWHQLQAHIEGFFKQTLTNDMQKIEYKPRYITLLELLSENQTERTPENGNVT
ncbi:MAG: hypothetical protein ACYDGO_14465 [Smithellaceae bacterium]